MSLNIQWNYYCNLTHDVKQLKYSDMLFNQGMILGKQENLDSIELYVDAIGCEKDTIKVISHHDRIVITFPDTEFRTGFQKEINFGVRFDHQNAKASYENGVLTIELPYKDEYKAKEIEVNG